MTMASTASATKNGSSEGPQSAAANDEAESQYTLTVEQLAGEVGMSVRNIRNHHSRVIQRQRLSIPAPLDDPAVDSRRFGEQIGALEDFPHER